jgi:hypothetical protein
MKIELQKYILGCLLLFLVTSCNIENQRKLPVQGDAQTQIPLIDKDLIEYASECDSAIGESVNQFSCSDGAVLPMIGEEGKSCEKPPYLPAAGCFNYSRIGQQVVSNDKAKIVFLCRHKSAADESSHFYEDVAVIQTNTETGATCFYQKLNKTPTIDGSNVPAPKEGKFWMTPTEIGEKGNACVQCHDSGPFLRTPYVMQKADVITAFSKNHRNFKNYWFPGDKFLNWNGKVYQAKIEGNTKCSGLCHTMGSNAINPNLGTSSWLAPLSTGKNPTPDLKGVHGNIAFWMKPGLNSPDDQSQQASVVLSDCAKGMPSANCTLTLWGGQLEAINQILRKNPTQWQKLLQETQSFSK